MWVWGENNRNVRSWGTLLGSQHFEGRGVCWSSGMGLGRMTSNHSLTWTCTNQTSWLMCRWSTFGARTSHMQTWTHKTHHGLDLGEASTFSFIVYSMLGHGTNTQMSFCPRIPKSWKFPQLGLLQLWGPITLHANLRLRWGLKQSCIPCRKISNGILQATCTQGNQVSINF